MAAPVTLIEGDQPGWWADSRIMPLVAGRRDGDQWQVWMTCNGYIIELTPARARQLAADMLAVCEVIDGVHSAVAVLDSMP